MIAYWFLSKLEKADYWLSLLWSITLEKNEGKAAINSSRILQYPIIYDLNQQRNKNRPIIDIDNTRRTLAEQNLLIDYEKIIISFFKKLNPIHNKSEKDQQFEKLLVDLEGLSEKLKAAKQGMPPGIQEMTIWAKSKLENKPMRDFL